MQILIKLQALSFLRILKFPILLILFIFTSISFGQSYYYRETFETNIGQTEWTNELYYGMEKVAVSRIEISTQAIDTKAAGKLALRGNCNSGGVGYEERNGYWVGKWIFNNNRYDASAEKPFGVEIIREMCELDPDTGATDPADARAQVFVGMALFVDQNPPMIKTYLQADRTDEWTKFANYFNFVDRTGCLSRWANDVFQMISYYDGSENSLNANCRTAALSPRGTAYNISNLACFNYQLTGGGNNPNAPNNNPLGFRITHDGTYLRLYINPNPYNTTAGYPNEWLLITTQQVLWKNNIQFMIGHGQMCNNSVSVPQIDANFDNLLIKSSADVSKQSINPNSMPASTTLTDYKTLTLVFSNTILKQSGKTNAGINYIKITKPSEFSWPSTITLTNNNRTNFCIRVRDNYDNNVSQRTLINYNFSTNMTLFFAAADRTMIKTNGTTYILF